MASEQVGSLRLELFSSDFLEIGSPFLPPLLTIFQDGTITWAEYICVISLILDGTLEERIKLIFNCFDEDGDGELTKAEFITAAKRFSSSEQSIDTLVDSVFTVCDLNGIQFLGRTDILSGDGKVTYSEFVAWQMTHPEEFKKFTGSVHILEGEAQ